MSSTTFYIVRHGESEWNVKGLVQGQSQHHNPLTEKGREQARAIGEKLSQIKFDAIYSSDLMRTQETAQIINEKLRLPVTHAAPLREQTHGRYEGTNGQEYLKLFTKWNELTDEERHVYKVIGEGETNKDVVERFTAFLKRLAAEHPGETILIISHGGIMRYFLIMQGYGTYDELAGIENTGFIHVEYQDNAFKIINVVGKKESKFM